MYRFPQTEISEISEIQSIIIIMIHISTLTLGLNYMKILEISGKLQRNFREITMKFQENYSEISGKLQ
jgi:hypothetical protein